jgi:hypothetical protein
MSLGGKGAGDNFAKDLFTDSSARSGRVLLAACLSGQIAYESDELGHGVFTYFLLEGIESKHADADYDGRVDADELAGFVRGRMDLWERDEGFVQTPQYDNPTSAEAVVVPKWATAAALPTQGKQVGALWSAPFSLAVGVGLAGTGNSVGPCAVASTGDRLRVRLAAVRFGSPYTCYKVDCSVLYALLDASQLQPVIGGGLGVFVVSVEDRVIPSLNIAAGLLWRLSATVLLDSELTFSRIGDASLLLVSTHLLYEF